MGETIEVPEGGGDIEYCVSMLQVQERELDVHIMDMRRCGQISRTGNFFLRRWRKKATAKNQGDPTRWEERG